MPHVRLQLTLDIDTEDLGIKVISTNGAAGPDEDDVCDSVYSYFEERAEELADLVKQEIDERMNYQDLVHNVEFVEWEKR